MLTRRTVIAGLAHAGASPAWAATELSPAAVRGDIAILRRAYQTLHPGLYRYSTPGQTATRFEALERAWSKAQTLGEAYLSLSRFLGTVRCGHTYANFYNQKRTVSDALFAGRTRLPFQFIWRNDRVVVTRNLSDDPRLAPGAEVLSVNGRDAGAIRRGLMPYARADGHNDAKRRALIEVRGDGRFETFDIFHPLVFGPPGDAFRLRVRPFGGQVVTMEAAPIDLAERRAAMKASADENAPAWTFAIDDGVGVLTMPNWALYNSTWDWRAFLDGVFVQLADASVRGLIIDLRGNEGGLDCGDPILARLTAREITLGGDERRVRYRKTPPDLDPYLDTWDDSFRDWGVDAIDLGDGFYRLTDRRADGAGVNLIRPLGPRFTDPVIVIVDAQNSSATFQFAAAVQANGLGRLMGSPTGGNRRGSNGGAFFFLRLPGCGLEADLPLIGRFPRTPQADAGLLPDIMAQDSIADIAAGRDGVLATARARLTSRT